MAKRVFAGRCGGAAGDCRQVCCFLWRQENAPGRAAEDFYFHRKLRVAGLTAFAVVLGNLCTVEAQEP